MDDTRQTAPLLPTAQPMTWDPMARIAYLLEQVLNGGLVIEDGSGRCYKVRLVDPKQEENEPRRSW